MKFEKFKTHIKYYNERIKDLDQYYSSKLPLVDSSIPELWLDIKDQLYDVWCNIEDSKKLSISADSELAFHLNHLVDAQQLKPTFEFWKWFNVHVFYDVILERRAGGDKVFPKDYFGRSRRNYGEALYVFYKICNKEGTPSITKERMIRLSTQGIQDLVERPQGGYDYVLFQTIAERYDNFILTSSKKPKKFLSAIMCLNTIKRPIFLPSAFTNGVEGYVDHLFNTILENQ